MSWTINIDGAARGNPGPAAFAYVLTHDGSPDIEAKGYLGATTNNVAEYTALVRALERAAQLGADRLLIRSDSELLVKQMNGEYRVKNADLRILYDQAQQLRKRFALVTIRHVPRAQNSRADSLCNEALDGVKPSSGSPVVKSQSSSKKRLSPREQAVHEAAVEWLRAVAGCWAKGNPDLPSPEDVWDHLWNILEDNGVLRPSHKK